MQEKQPAYSTPHSFTRAHYTELMLTPSFLRDRAALQGILEVAFSGSLWGLAPPQAIGDRRQDDKRYVPLLRKEGMWGPSELDARLFGACQCLRAAAKHHINSTPSSQLSPDHDCLFSSFFLVFLIRLRVRSNRYTSWSCLVLSSIHRFTSPSFKSKSILHNRQDGKGPSHVSKSSISF